MTASCCRRSRRPLGVAAAGALLALLVPKCPLCLATYLSFLGAAATGVVWLRPLGVALMLAGVAVAAWRHLARGPSPAPTRYSTLPSEGAGASGRPPTGTRTDGGGSSTTSSSCSRSMS